MTSSFGGLDTGGGCESGGTDCKGEAGVLKGWYADFYVINDVIYDIIFYASGYAGVYKNSLDSE